MQEAVARRRERLYSMGERMQPMVVLVGDLKSISCAYVVLDETTWMVQSPVKAVDICFKAYHVLHAKYPVETQAWMLLQKFVYDINTKWDVKSTALLSLMSELNKC